MGGTGDDNTDIEPDRKKEKNNKRNVSSLMRPTAAATAVDRDTIPEQITAAENLYCTEPFPSRAIKSVSATPSKNKINATNHFR